MLGEDFTQQQIDAMFSDCFSKYVTETSTAFLTANMSTEVMTNNTTPFHLISVYEFYRHIFCEVFPQNQFINNLS